MNKEEKLLSVTFFNRADFTELIKNHTVESYSKAIEEDWAPVQILENVNKAWMPRIQQAWDKRRAADIMKPMMRWNAGGRKPF